MTLNTTMELTRGELGILWRALTEQEAYWEGEYERGRKAGFRDMKEADRVATYRLETSRLVNRIETVIKEMDGRNA
jgi:hypothetical protein